MPRSIASLLTLVPVVPVFLVAACRAPSVARIESTGCHAACPGAPQAAIVDAGASLRGAPIQTAMDLTNAGERAPSAAAYLCPMHPHIGSDMPGRCPECGMELVPRAQVLEHDHGH